MHKNDEHLSSKSYAMVSVMLLIICRLMKLEIAAGNPSRGNILTSETFVIKRTKNNIFLTA